MPRSVHCPEPSCSDRWARSPAQRSAIRWDHRSPAPGAASARKRGRTRDRRPPQRRAAERPRRDPTNLRFNLPQSRAPKPLRRRHVNLPRNRPAVRTRSRPRNPSNDQGARQSPRSLAGRNSEAYSAEARECRRNTPWRLRPGSPQSRPRRMRSPTMAKVKWAIHRSGIAVIAPATFVALKLTALLV